MVCINYTLNICQSIAQYDRHPLTFFSNNKETFEIYTIKTKIAINNIIY